MTVEPPAPVLLRYVDLTLPGSTVQLTLFPADTLEILNDPPRLVAQLREKADETFTAFLGPGVTIRESSGLQQPIPLDEQGQPRRFANMDEYRAYVAANRPT